MHTEIEAKEKVLELVNSGREKDEDNEFVIISGATLSENKDYWIIRANSRACVEGGDQSMCYVGVNAYLVNTESGEIEIVGSATSVESFLQQKYDLRAANGKHYVLICCHDHNEKEIVIKIHRLFNCSLKKAKYLLSERKHWLTGQKIHLLSAQKLLREKGIETQIALLETTESAIAIDSEFFWWERLEKVIANELAA